jgi:serine/threonine-protein kinase
MDERGGSPKAGENPLATDQVNDSFEILERTGDGALFEVFKARQKESGRVVALKMLLPAYQADAALASALRHSMRAVLGLSHPNIARVESVEDANGIPYVVTEYVRGINLKERIRRIAPFTLSVATDFAISIAEALQYAHSQGAVHGDVRPQNVVVSPEGALKVTDFGLTPVLLASQEAAGANLGRSIPYQAPELASGAPASPATDIYSLGVVLFEMLTGGLPYQGETPLLMAARHQQERVPSARTFNPGVPRSLDGIVMKAMLKRPADRYASAADLLTDLRSVRDALRFGKPLSWSPLDGQDIDALAIAGVVAAPVVAAAATPDGPVPSPRAARPRREREPDPEPAAGVARMPAKAANNANNDAISPFLKFLLAGVTMVLLVSVIAAAAVWMATFAKPPEQVFPKLVGMNIEAARGAAEKANVRLMEHETFHEKIAAGTVLRTDPDLSGRPVRPGRSINVWVSKGSKMVYVPDVTNKHKDEADSLIKQSGMILGNVDRQHSDKVAFDYVISQNPRPRKRVKRDQEINLIVSDGPKPEPPVATPPDEGVPTETTEPAPDAQGGETTTSAEGATTRRVTLSKDIPRDGLGSRRVRIEYLDAVGIHQAVDEVHGEGERVEVKVEAVGPKITVRVYYGDSNRPSSERTLTLK